MKSFFGQHLSQSLSIEFVLRTASLSHAPPKWHAYDGINMHSIVSFSNRSLILCRSNWFIFVISSREAPTKFLPLSETMRRGFPRRAVNLSIA